MKKNKEPNQKNDIVDLYINLIANCIILVFLLLNFCMVSDVIINAAYQMDVIEYTVSNFWFVLLLDAIFVVWSFCKSGEDIYEKLD